MVLFSSLPTNIINLIYNFYGETTILKINNINKCSILPLKYYNNLFIRKKLHIMLFLIAKNILNDQQDTNDIFNITLFSKRNARMKCIYQIDNIKIKIRKSIIKRIVLYRDDRRCPCCEDNNFNVVFYKNGDLKQSSYYDIYENNSDLIPNDTLNITKFLKEYFEYTLFRYVWSSMIINKNRNKIYHNNELKFDVSESNNLFIKKLNSVCKNIL